MTETEVVKQVYAAINRNDIPAALKDFDPQFVRIEPQGFPMSGIYKGLVDVQAHFEKARSTWAEGACEPERLVVAGDKIIALVHVRVRLKDQSEWLEGRLADVFTFRNGKVIEMRCFEERQEALKWAGSNEIVMTPWTQTDKDQWFKKQTIKRSYQEQVVAQILGMKSLHEVVEYGAISVSGNRYPLYLIKSKNQDPGKTTVLITGGVHGYETSGVQGALAFMKNDAHPYATQFNFICTPCISPWAYETINRWNPNAIDPNRSFIPNSPAEECSLFLKALAPDLSRIVIHFDLHETTDTDNTVFRLELQKRDGKANELSEIPDGFYAVGDSENPCPDFQKAVIDSVRKVTHIAAPDNKGKIIGEKIEQDGVINYPMRKLSLCAGITKAKYTTTTEVYPDSPRVTDQICVDAQVAAIRGGLDWFRQSTP